MSTPRNGSRKTRKKAGATRAGKLSTIFIRPVARGAATTVEAGRLLACRGLEGDRYADDFDERFSQAGFDQVRENLVDLSAARSQYSERLAAIS